MSECTQPSHHLLIAEYADINGGYPVIAMTRIGVRLIVQAFRELGDFEGTVEAYPQLRREQVQAALDYYGQHPARIEEDIERNERTLDALRARRG